MGLRFSAVAGTDLLTFDLSAIVTLTEEVRTLYGGFEGHTKRSLTRMRGRQGLRGWCWVGLFIFVRLGFSAVAGTDLLTFDPSAIVIPTEEVRLLYGGFEGTRVYRAAPVPDNKKR